MIHIAQIDTAKGMSVRFRRAGTKNKLHDLSAPHLCGKPLLMHLTCQRFPEDEMSAHKVRVAPAQDQIRILSRDRPECDHTVVKNIRPRFSFLFPLPVHPFFPETFFS